MNLNHLIKKQSLPHVVCWTLWLLVGLPGWSKKGKQGPNFGVGLTKKHVLTIHQQDQRSKRLSLRTKSSRVSSSCAQLVPGLCQQCANNPFSCNTTKQATSGLKLKPSNKRAYFGDQCYVLGSLHFCNRKGLSSPTQKYLAISSSAYKIGDQIKARPAGTKWGKDLVTKSKLPQCSPPCL